MFFLIGVAIYLLGVFMVAYFKHVGFEALFNPVAIFTYLFAIPAVLTATNSFGVFWGGLKAAIFPKKPISEEVRGRAATLFRLLSKTTALSIPITVIISIIAALGNITQLDRMAASAMSFLVTPIWGIFLIVAVFEPVVFILKKRQDEERQSKAKTKQKGKPKTEPKDEPED